MCGLPATPVELPLVPDACGGLLPPGLVEPVATAVARFSAGVPDRLPATDRGRAAGPVRVAPGSLGCAAP